MEDHLKAYLLSQQINNIDTFFLLDSMNEVLENLKLE